MGMSDNIAHTPEFRQRIIAMLLYTDWLVRYGPILKPEHFPVQSEKSLVGWINDYYSKYKDAPYDDELQEGILRELDDEDALDATNLLKSVSRHKEESAEHIADKAMEFAQTQAMKIAILESVDCIKDGDLSTPLRLVKDAQRVGQDRLSLGLELVDDAEDWVYDELHGRRFPTGLPQLDGVIGGGLVGGEYGLVMAPPGRGKSTLLINIGYGMAGLTGAANVLSLTYEMPASKYLKRYALRVAGITLSRGHGDEKRYISSLRARAKQRLRGKLRVRKPDDYSVDGIRRLIDALAAENWTTEALIVDYPDLMAPMRKRRELRFELADIARDLRALGVEYGMPVWGATQAGRQAIYKEVITLADVAEAIEKTAIADVVVSICQTREEEKLGHGRLFMAKIRDGEDKFIVPVTINFGQQAITPRHGLDVPKG